MDRNKKMKIKSVLLALYVLSNLTVLAQYPYFNSGQNKEGFILLGESRTGLVTYSNNGIKLLDAQNQFSGVYLNNLSFTTEKGFILEFEFGIDIGRMDNSKYGDGIGVVLFDAKQSTPSLGDKGGALGYAYTKKYSNVHIAGFSQGIFGLGLDLYGNYKRAIRANDGVRNGITTLTDGDFVVLRGPYNPNNPYEGYPVLFAIGTKTNVNLYLNRNNGQVMSRSKGFEGQRFNLRGAALNAKPGEAGYRKIRIAFVPGIEEISERQGFFVFVDITHGIYNSTIIKNYFVSKSETIKYKEEFTEGIQGSAIKTLVHEIPEKMKMGFTGSTGVASIRAHIRNISLSLPFSPEVQDIVIPDVIYDRPSVSMPLYSAIGYKSNVYSVVDPPHRSISFLDLNSFRFKVFDTQAKKYVVNKDPFKLVVSKVGTFTYDVNTGSVTFVPVEGFREKSYTYYYDIKNKRPIGGTDISTEEYRSTTASVTLNFTDYIPLYRNPPLLVNKGVKKVK